jgi:hypothetical protein
MVFRQDAVDEQLMSDALTAQAKRADDIVGDRVPSLTPVRLEGRLF